MYDFKTQLDEGEAEERRLDALFSQWYSIEPASMTEQRKGIDRVFTDRDGCSWTVQYKTDWKAAQTRNLFVELMSADPDDLGWSYTCLAQQLIYNVPPTSMIYIIPMTTVKQHFRQWAARYSSRTIPNMRRNGTRYNTIGVPVPIAIIEPLCVAVLRNGKRVA